MATNDFSAEADAKYTQKCLCVLVLDVSESMGAIAGGDTWHNSLNIGLQNFYNEIYRNDVANQRIEIALVTFNDSVKILQTPALLENFMMPTLTFGGKNTAFADAITCAIKLVDDRRRWYKVNGQPYHRPWIVLMTDGEPNADQEVKSLNNKIKSDTKNKKYIFSRVGVEDGNKVILHSFEGRDSDDITFMLPGDVFKVSDFFKRLWRNIDATISGLDIETPL